MGYTDEQILRAKRKDSEAKAQKEKIDLLEQENEKSIYDEDFTLFGEAVTFKSFYLFDGRVCIDMPEDAELLSEEEVSQQFFLGSKPQYVYKNGQQTFNVCFNYTENKVPNETIWDFIKAFQLIIERIGPGTKIIDRSQWEENNIKYAMIEFISQTIDASVYNMMFFASLDGRLIIGSVNYLTTDSRRLKTVGLEMIHSFHLIEKEGGSE